MPTFNYVAIDKTGQELKGILEGDGARQIRQQLRSRGMTPIAINPVREKSQRSALQLADYFSTTRLSISELALITRQLATLLNSGMPLEEVLLAVSEQTEKQKTKSILLSVRDKVMEGHSMASGMKEHPKAFPTIYVASVNAGEKSGHLDQVLEQLANFAEKQHHIKQKVQQALIYPAVMTLVSVSIVSFLLVFVVPKMVAVFTDTGQTLPILTTILISISDFIKHYGGIVVVLLIIGLWGFRIGLKNTKFIFQVHRLLLKIPFISRSIKVINTARFSRTFGMLSSAGVPVLDAMSVASDMMSNILIKAAVHDAIKQVREGALIHRALKKTTYFPAMSIHLIASGEASGKLDEMLIRAADNQDHDMEMLIDSSLSLFEPMMILMMGTIVLFIVLAILLPIFNLNQMIK